MELHFTDAVMEDGTSGCTGRWQLPWNGWGEVLLEDCTSFTLGDEGCEDLPTADTSLKVDCTSSHHFAGIDDDVCIATEFFDGGSGFTTDMGFTDLTEVCPLVNGCEQLDLCDLFEASEPGLDCEDDFLNLAEQITNHESIEDLLLPHNVELGSYLDSLIKSVTLNSNCPISSASNEDTLDSGCPISSTSNEECSMSVVSLSEFDSVEELVVSCSETAVDAGSLSPEHINDQSLADSDYEIENGSDDDDDYDWELTRKPKRGKKRKVRTGSNDRGKKFSRIDPESRKKEQNKNAATRYREKKRVEEMEREALCGHLESRNRELRKEIKDKENEVKLLKELLVNVLRPSTRN